MPIPPASTSPTGPNIPPTRSTWLNLPQKISFNPGTSFTITKNQATNVMSPRRSSSSPTTANPSPSAPPSSKTPTPFQISAGTKKTTASPSPTLSVGSENTVLLKSTRTPASSASSLPRNQTNSFTSLNTATTASLAIKGNFSGSANAPATITSISSTVYQAMSSAPSPAETGFSATSSPSMKPNAPRSSKSPATTPAKTPTIYTTPSLISTLPN